MAWEAEDFQTTRVSLQTLQVCISNQLDLSIKVIKKKCENHRAALENICLVPSIKNRTDQLTLLLLTLLNDKNNYKKVDNKAVDPNKVHMRSSTHNMIFSKVTFQRNYRSLSTKPQNRNLFKFRVKVSVKKVVLLWECCNKNRREKKWTKHKTNNLYMERIRFLG